MAPRAVRKRFGEELSWEIAAPQRWGARVSRWRVIDKEVGAGLEFTNSPSSKHPNPVRSFCRNKWVLGPPVAIMAVVSGVLGSAPPIAAVILAAIAGVLVAALVPLRVLLLVWPFSLVFWSPIAQIADYNITLSDALTGVLWIHCVMHVGRWWRSPSFSGLFRLLVIGIAPAIPLGLAGALNFGGQGLIVSVGLFMKRWGIYTILPLSAALDRSAARLHQWSFLLASSVAMGVGLLNDVGLEGRGSGVLFNPNTLGVFAVVGINLCIHLLTQESKAASRKVILPLALLHFLGLGLSGSREAWIALGVSLVYWAFQSKHRKLVVVSLLLGIVALSLPLSSISRTRLSTVLAEGVQEENVSGRLEAVRAGFRLFLDYPFGVGIGNIQTLGRDYLAMYGQGDYSLYLWREGFTTTDNTYVDELIEGGLPSLIFVLWALSMMWQLSSKGSPARATILAMMVAGLASVSLQVPFLTGALWFVVATDQYSRQRGGQLHEVT